MGLPLGIPSVALDGNLFQEEATGEGEAWGEVRLLQASVSGIVLMHPPPHLHHPPIQLQPCRGSGTSSCSAGSPTGTDWQDAGWLLGQPWVPKPQQCPRLAKGQPWASKGTVGRDVW